MFRRIKRDKIIKKYDKKIQRIKEQRNKKLLHLDGYLIFCPHCKEPLNLDGIVEHYIEQDGACEYTFRCIHCNKTSTWIDGILPCNGKLLKDQK